MLAAFTTPIAKGFDLLACPRDPLAFDQISKEAVLRILEIACEAYDFVIVDLPRHRRPWTLEVLAGSDEVFVVSELTVPALLAARALGLDCGPMSGFDHAGVDGEFFSGRRVVTNFVCSLGYASRVDLFPRLPRLAFEDACELL